MKCAQLFLLIPPSFALLSQAYSKADEGKEACKGLFVIIRTHHDPRWISRRMKAVFPDFYPIRHYSVSKIELNDDQIFAIRHQVLGWACHE